MEQTFLRVMALQSQMKTLSNAQFQELKQLLTKVPCDCQKPTDCIGICTVNRRVTEEQNRRGIGK